jgi:ribosomal protein L12E/L44/L45/RPP1/RPP2
MLILLCQSVCTYRLQELLLSYNLGVDPDERNKEMVAKTAARVGFQLPQLDQQQEQAAAAAAAAGDQPQQQGQPQQQEQRQQPEQHQAVHQQADVAAGRHQEQRPCGGGSRRAVAAAAFVGIDEAPCVSNAHSRDAES